MTGENLFGQVLQQMRARRKLSQKEAADAADISDAYWGGIERGATSIDSVSFETLWAMIAVVTDDLGERRRLLTLAGGKHRALAEAVYAASASGPGVPPLEAVIEASPELHSSEDRAALKRMVQVMRQARPVPMDVEEEAT